jgi:hypothetical protein
MTVGELRAVLADVTDDMPIHVGVFGLRHFNTVLLRKEPGAVLLYVKSLS